MRRLPAFSVILIFVVLSIVGVAMIPFLSLQYTPTEKKTSLTVSYAWGGASAKLIEANVTTVIEGLASAIEGVGSVRSVSQKGMGSVILEVKDKRQVERVRFELSTRIRQIFDRLPAGVSFPLISGSSSGGEIEPILTWTINADMPTAQIERYVQREILDEISTLPGVASVSLAGITPFYREVAFNADRLKTYGLQADDLRQSLLATLTGAQVVGTTNGLGVTLRYGTLTDDLENLPVGYVEGRIIHLGDVATISDHEQTPERYYRINGLNTINLTVYPEIGANTLSVCDAAKAKMQELSAAFPDRFAAVVTYDSSDYLRDEIHKILRRTILSVAILLIFVLLTTRNLRYLTVVVAGLTANLLISVIFYVLFGIEIHLWSMAGITVSLSILIDAVIVMVAHYGYYRNRRVFLALLAAQLTTVGALSVIFLLPEEQRQGFTDFAAVVMVNLAVSLPVTMLLIPALVDMLKMQEYQRIRSFRARRRTILWNRWYRSYITFARKWRWATILLVVLAFGIPFSQLPDSVKGDSFFSSIYNNVFGSRYFKDNLKTPLDHLFGGSIGLFFRHTHRSIDRKTNRQTLYIRASLPNGCTIAQLNSVVLSMENYLAGFSEIESYRTSIISHNNASIIVNFLPIYEKTAIPVQIKNQVIAKADSFGGATWNIYGINEERFNNDVETLLFKSQRIFMTGYNYDILYDYCVDAVEHLLGNPLVSQPDIYGVVEWDNSLSYGEYYLTYNTESLARQELSVFDAYNVLCDRLSSSRVGEIALDDEYRSVYLNSDIIEDVELWNLQNEYINVDGNMFPFSQIGTIDYRQSGIDIYRQDHQYALTIAYDYLGSRTAAKKVLDKETERLNSLLPFGYRAKQLKVSFSDETSRFFILILLVVFIIFVICSIHFESLVLPLAIIGLIPFSFIGCFLIFAITGAPFDQGGFAALVMLAGLVVNAGIYIVQEWRQQNPKRRSFVRAFNHKIIPTLLTIASTALGLLPFLFDGPSEVFWYPFSLGTIGGLIFSFFALVFLLPIWITKE